MADVMASAGVTPVPAIRRSAVVVLRGGVGDAVLRRLHDDDFQARVREADGGDRRASTRTRRFPEECAFLPGLIGEFTDAVMAYVRQTHPDTRFEVLYPPDVNDTPLNRVMNFPHGTGRRRSWIA